MMENEDEPICKWCGDKADEPHGGFYYEPDEDTLSEAEEGFYCSTACWISAG